VTLFATHESRDHTAPPSIDYLGVVTLTAGLGSLVLALVESNAWGWGSGRIAGLLAVAVVGLVAFAVVEARIANPMVDFKFFRSRSFAGANVVAFIVSFAMLATFFFFALYLQNIHHYSPLQTGVRFLPTTAVIIVVGPIAGRLSDRIGPRPLIALGLVLNAVSLFWQGHVAADTSYGFLVGAFVLMGLGMGLVMSPMSTAAMNAIDPTKAGVASGVLSMSRMVGGTFGVAAMGALITGLGRHKIDQTLPQLPAQTRHDLAENLGAGSTGGTGAVHDAVQQAFLYALNDGLRIAAVVSAVGAAAAWWLIAPGAPHRQPVHDADSAEVGTGDGGAELAAAETALA
jgi:MFS family permease